ncbi:MAG TPA: heme-binding protein, partial [Casimicrobiaceae bacterium]|nr:heme-binding protein [Casimicrobiaceae bacterium]
MTSIDWRRVAGFIVLSGALCAAATAQTKPTWADPAKTLRVAFPVAETGFDPQATSELYSNHIERAIFDTLYVFDYLARPYKLITSAAAAMPEIADGGRTWTIRVRPGIYFTDDPAFKGKKRELTAAD